MKLNNMKLKFLVLILCGALMVSAVQAMEEERDLDTVSTVDFGLETRPYRHLN